MNKKLNSLMKRKPIQTMVTTESSDESVIKLLLYGDISPYAYYSGISLDKVVEELAGKSAETIEVHINSYGGDMFESIAIKNYLKRRPEKIVTCVDGIAASGGSIIAMSGDEIVMYKDSEMMIHNPWTFAYGNADDFRKLADELETANISVQETYMSHFNGERETLIELLEKDSWLTADEALSYGLATSIEEFVKESKEDPQEPIVIEEPIENKINQTITKGTQKVAFFSL